MTVACEGFLLGAVKPVQYIVQTFATRLCPSQDVATRCHRPGQCCLGKPVPDWGW